MKHNSNFILIILSLFLLVAFIYTPVFSQSAAATMQSMIATASANKNTSQAPVIQQPQPTATAVGYDLAATVQSVVATSPAQNETNGNMMTDLFDPVSAQITQPTQNTNIQQLPTANPVVSLPQVTIPQQSSGQSPKEIRQKLNIHPVGVQEGDFIMGSRNHHEENRPAHTVFLDTYYIMAYETTGAQYTECVNEGVCTPAEESISGQYPQTNVTWNQAEAFCEWIGGSLPTEAQWEKAARGTIGNPYPWGTNVNYDAYLARLNADSPSPVGSYTTDVSPYFAYDMGGNVNEWCFDWYDPEYYKYGEATNPTGPESGTSRVVRGGSYNRDYTMVYIRKQDSKFTPDTAKSYVGFRCAFTNID